MCPLSPNHRGKPLDLPPSPKGTARNLIKKVTLLSFSDNRCDHFLFLMLFTVSLSASFLWCRIFVYVYRKAEIIDLYGDLLQLIIQNTLSFFGGKSRLFIRVSFRIRSSFVSSHSRTLPMRKRLYGNTRSLLPRVFQGRFSAL